MNKSLLSKIVISFLASTVALSFAQEPKPQDRDKEVILDTFKWFNEISSKKRQGFSQEDVAKHFANDAKMLTNDKLVCTGINAHYDHFIELNRHYAFLRANVENMDIHQSGDRYYLHYTIEGESTQAKPVKMHIMGYMVVHDHRITLFNEIVAKDASV